uniref:Uncharacterized protein n=1 Tax=viral metagenome TaxID=1070528 RepID=A0A6C0I3P7_9ZZZZ
MQLLPYSLVNDIVALANTFNKRDAWVIQIDPVLGGQRIEPNPIRLTKLTDSVKEMALLLKKQMVARRLLNEVDAVLSYTGFLYYEVPELVLKREARRLIHEFATNDPDVDQLVQQSAYCWWDSTIVDPIAEDFYKQAYDIAEQISDLSEQTRIQYFTKIIEDLHRENPELDIPMYDLITGYTQHDQLHQCVTQNMFPTTVEQLEQRNGPINDFISLLVECSHDKCVSNLDLFEWANRSKESRYRWLTVVNGEYKNKRDPHRALLREQILKLYPRSVNNDLFEMLHQMEKRELDYFVSR